MLLQDIFYPLFTVGGDWRTSVRVLWSGETEEGAERCHMVEGTENRWHGWDIGGFKWEKYVLQHILSWWNGLIAPLLPLTDWFINLLAPGRSEWKFREVICMQILLNDGWDIVKLPSSECSGNGLVLSDNKPIPELNIFSMSPQGLTRPL